MIKETNWQQLPIGKIGKVVTGKTPPTAKPELFGNVYPFITPTDIDGVSRKITTERFLSDDGRKSQKNLLLPSKTICFVCIGATIGKMCLTDKLSFTNQQINSIIVNEESFDPLFVYYAIKHISHNVKTLAGGAATPIINKTAFSDISISTPPFPIQRRIASILSAYDDLIENNTRRIAILEEMARRIYEEWFVKFKFPGHEKVKMVDSELGKIPEGWNKTELINLCNSIEDGDWIETKDQGGSDFRLLQISNVGLNSFVETGNYRFISSETFKQLRCREVIPGHILVARMPKPIGRAWLVTPQQWRMITAVDVAIVEPNRLVTSPEFLLHFLNSAQTLAAFAGQTSGTTRPRITRRQIEGMPIVAPPAELAHSFEQLIGPMNELCALYMKRNTNLRTTRDFLLPKLISGEIDVSKLPEPEEAAA